MWNWGEKRLVWGDFAKKALKLTLFSLHGGWDVL
jgi:hypothetical protein